MNIILKKSEVQRRKMPQFKAFGMIDLQCESQKKSASNLRKKNKSFFSFTFQNFRANHTITQSN